MKVKTMSNTQKTEVDENYKEFLKLYPSIKNQHANKYALMKDRKIIAYFSSVDDARSAAEQFIDDGIYSVQKVSNDEINLGFYNYAVPVN